MILLAVAFALIVLVAVVGGIGDHGMDGTGEEY